MQRDRDQPMDQLKILTSTTIIMCEESIPPNPQKIPTQISIMIVMTLTHLHQRITNLRHPHIVQAVPTSQVLLPIMSQALLPITSQALLPKVVMTSHSLLCIVKTTPGQYLKRSHQNHHSPYWRASNTSNNWLRKFSTMCQRSSRLRPTRRIQSCKKSTPPLPKLSLIQLLISNHRRRKSSTLLVRQEYQQKLESWSSRLPSFLLKLPILVFTSRKSWDTSHITAKSSSMTRSEMLYTNLKALSHKMTLFGTKYEPTSKQAFTRLQTMS